MVTRIEYKLILDNWNIYVTIGINKFQRWKMILNKEISELIDAPVKIKLLRYILSRGFTMTGRELARISKASHTSVNRIMREFEAVSLVYPHKAGTAMVWNVNIESYAYEKLSKIMDEIIEKPLKSFIDSIKKAFSKKKVLRIMLFGSIAVGKEKEGRDIDLFILVNNETGKKAIEPILKKLGVLCIRKYGNALMPYVLSEQEYKKKKGLKLIKDIEKGIKII